MNMLKPLPLALALGLTLATASAFAQAVKPKAASSAAAEPSGRLAKGEKQDKADIVITEAAEPATDVSTVNPLTGKLISEELLQRKLGVAKLKTQLRQEEIKLLQIDRTNQLEIDKVKSDRLKATLESTAAARQLLSPSNDEVRRTRVRTRVDVPPPPPAEPVTQMAPVAPPVALLPPPPPPPSATGTITIGGETLRPVSSFSGVDARVSFVDEQRSSAPGGAPQGFTPGLPSGAVLVPAGTQPPGLPPVGQPLRPNTVSAMPSPLFPQR